MASNRNYNTVTNNNNNNSNFTQLQSQVEDVKGVMTQNIDKILKRGDRLEDLVDKTTELESTVIQILFFLHPFFLMHSINCFQSHFFSFFLKGHSIQRPVKEGETQNVVEELQDDIHSNRGRHNCDRCDRGRIGVEVWRRQQRWRLDHIALIGIHHFIDNNNNGTTNCIALYAVVIFCQRQIECKKSDPSFSTTFYFSDSKHKK